MVKNIERHILHLDLHLHAYEIQLTQQLKPADHSQLLRYVEWEWLEQQAIDSNFSNTTFFSDKAHFTLVVYANKQNCCIWCYENPQVIEKGLYMRKKSLFGALFGLKV